MYWGYIHKAEMGFLGGTEIQSLIANRQRGEEDDCLAGTENAKAFGVCA